MEPIENMPQKEFIPDSEPEKETEICKPDELKPLHNNFIPPGAKTSSYYRTQQIPDRFENPGKCYIPGNAIFSCSRDIEAQNTYIPKQDDWFQGYEKRKVHPMYRTSSAEYGGRAPNVHSMPSKFFPMSQEFSHHLGKCGMYRNHSLNCALDKTVVPDH